MIWQSFSPYERNYGHQFRRTIDGAPPRSDHPGAGVARERRVHPLVSLAEQKLADAAAPGRMIDMDGLLAWLGARVNQAVYEIDPLRINVTAVAEVMSRAFAERHRILAVEVTEAEVVIASSEPYIKAWESNLEHVLRKRVRRVLTDPRVIARHTAEFYTMAGSVNRARGADRAASGVGVTNLEQML